MLRREVGLANALSVALFFALIAAQTAVVYRLWPGLPWYLCGLLAVTVQPLVRRIMARLVPHGPPVPLSRRRCNIFMGTTVAIMLPLVFLAGLFLHVAGPALSSLMGVPAAFGAHLLLTRWYRGRYYLVAWIPAPVE